MKKKSEFLEFKSDLIAWFITSIYIFTMAFFVLYSGLVILGDTWYKPFYLLFGLILFSFPFINLKNVINMKNN